MHRYFILLSLCTTLGLALFGSGCDSLMPCDETPGCRVAYDVGGGLDGLITGVGVGEDCSTEACRAGLACLDGQCEVGMSLEEGEQCVIGPECQDGLSCAVGPCPSEFLDFCPVCLATGDGAVGDDCQTDLDCSSGLKCGIVGFAGQCLEAKTADLGQACEVQTDCFQGLFCTEGQCSLKPPLFAGVDCPEPKDEEVMAYFSVPGAPDTVADADYFQFPFPNDFRLSSDGRPDLGDFPTPGPGITDVDIVERYVKAIEDKSVGWGTNPTILFRFSGSIDVDSLQEETDGFRGVEIIDVDNLPEDPEQGVRHHSVQYSVAGRSNYVCDNWLGLRSPRHTLVPGHRYVAMLRNGASAKGDPLLRSAQFEMMFDEGAPSNSVLKKAYEAYEPLRELIDFYQGSSFELNPDEITVATVFTTGDTVEPMRQLAQAVAREDVPQASEWVKCGADTESPCAQASADDNRACGSATDDYDEYQALLSVPIFQEGEAPYWQSGGGISESVVRSEKICLSLAIPKAQVPATGFPLVIYGHGTGGSYRSQLSDSVAGQLARAAVPTASLGFDQVQHGPRRGEGEGSSNDPDQLFFNFQNPDAARGNPLQGAADVLSVLRLVSQGSLASAEETNADAIVIDPARVVLYGHSQGSTHMSMALPFSSVPGAVLSGNGGGLVEALLNKTNPVNIARVLPYVIQDADDNGTLRMGDKHPVLALLQQYIDPADPLNFAPLLVVRPEEDQGLKSVFQTFGLDDTYAPPATLARYIYAAEQMILAPAPSGLNAQAQNVVSVAQSTDPVTANVTIDSQTASLVARQYTPVSDGHFVADEVEQANRDVMGFLASLLAEEPPTVPVQ